MIAVEDPTDRIYKILNKLLYRLISYFQNSKYLVYVLVVARRKLTDR